MSTVPANAKLRLEFYEAHIAPFTANAVAIGTTAAAVTDLTTKTTAARTKYNAKLAAEQAAKVATSEWRSAVTAMSIAGSAIIDQIRAKAKVTGGTSIYELAEIPAPATPSPVPAPGQPMDLVVTLTQSGAFNMKWKCPNPPGAGGTTYNVFRRVGATGEFSYIGGTGVREFEDETVPSGAALIMYKIQAVRSTLVGPFATFNVFLGVSSAGAAMIQSVVETTPPSSPKMAA
jgi:hypothetical protein